MSSEIQNTIISSLNTIYQELGIDEKVTSATIIYGPDEGINSLSLLRLIVDIEEAILNNTGKNIVLADDRSLSMQNSPFYSVETLTVYVNFLINE